MTPFFLTTSCNTGFTFHISNDIALVSPHSLDNQLLPCLFLILLHFLKLFSKLSIYSSVTTFSNSATLYFHLPPFFFPSFFHPFLHPPPKLVFFYVWLIIYNMWDYFSHQLTSGQGQVYRITRQSIFIGHDYRTREFGHLSVDEVEKRKSCLREMMLTV